MLNLATFLPFSTGTGTFLVSELSSEDFWVSSLFSAITTVFIHSDKRAEKTAIARKREDKPEIRGADLSFLSLIVWISLVDF